MPRQDQSYVDAIRASGLTIYDQVPPGQRRLVIPDKVLERILDAALRGLDVALPQRTRSKLVKGKICEALGFDIPVRFKKTHPRFPNQNFDTYVQKNNNLQIWNEQISPQRRYVLIMVSSDNIVSHVRVLNGEALALLDKTGTLTSKYQASLISPFDGSKIISEKDTDGLMPAICRGDLDFRNRRPTDEPRFGEILSIQDLFTILSRIVGMSFDDAGVGQERVRGGALHQIVCREFGYPTFSDNGQLPDILDQLLEVKLQLARTVDLGLVSPDSKSEVTSVPILNGYAIVHSDVRYAIFDAHTDGSRVTVSKLTLVNGAEFFRAFRRFEGKVVNRKLQIPLPNDLRNPGAAARSSRKP